MAAGPTWDPPFSWYDSEAGGHLTANLAPSFVVFIPIPMPLFKRHPCLDYPSLITLRTLPQWRLLQEASLIHPNTHKQPQPAVR